MLKRIPWVVIAVCLLIVSILLTLQQSLYPWPKRLRHVRLEPSRPILRDAGVTPDNAFFYLRQLTSAPVSSDEWSKEYDRFCDLGMAGGPYPALEARLTEIAGNLKLCRQAAALTTCQVVTMDSLNVKFQYVSPVRDVARNLQFSVDRAAAKGDWTAAGDDCRLALRVGDDLSRGGGLINHLVTYACGAYACSSLRRVAIETEPPPEFLHRMMQVLDELDRNTEPFAETIRYERLMSHDFVRTMNVRNIRLSTLRNLDNWSPGTSGSKAAAEALDVVGYGVLPLAGSTPRRTMAHFDAVYSHVIDIAAERRPSGRSMENEALVFLANGREPVRLLFNDPAGRVMVKLLVGYLDDAAAKHRVYVATLRGTELVLALRLYQQTHDSKLPARLEELVPDCLAAVPVDPFSPDGEPFLYRAEEGGKWVVYNRGPNLRDDGAVWNYLDSKIRSQHRDNLDVIFSSAEPEQRRDHWRLEHPGEK